MFRLMIKEHNKTGLKYLCITKKDDYEKYTGSGTRWRRHLKKHGCDFSTTVLYEDEDYDGFLEKCIFFSAEFNVALNEEFANLIPEQGYQFTSDFSWWDYATNEMIIKRNEKYRQTREQWEQDKKTDIIQRIVAGNKKRWENYTIEERRARMAATWEGKKRFLEQKGEKYTQWVEKLKVHFEKLRMNTPFDEVSARMRKARLYLSPEKREQRKQKILANHATGKYKHIWEKMGSKRRGIDNPAAKIVVWYGKEYTKGQFSRLNIPDNIFEEALLERDDCYKNYTDEKQYETMVCPYCGRSSNGKKLSGFKRYHLENCKEKNNAEVDRNS